MEHQLSHVSEHWQACMQPVDTSRPVFTHVYAATRYDWCSTTALTTLLLNLYTILRSTCFKAQQPHSLSAAADNCCTAGAQFAVSSTADLH
jgi:hypothetical protein